MSTLTLTQRAEQALIGALLAHPWQFVVFGEATRDDFADARLARVYGAMMGHWGTVAPDHIDEDLAPIAVSAQVAPSYLEYLKSVCPVPLHAGAYDNLVAEASARRGLRSDTNDLAVQAKAIGYGTLAGHSLMVAEAIKRHLISFDPDTVTAALTRPRTIQDSKREMAEESVLAAILNQHPQSMTMLEILRPTAWSDPARHEMHQAMVTLAASGRDIDPLTVDWEIACAREQNGESGGRVAAESAGPSYATKIAGIPVDGNPVRKANALMDAARRAARHEAEGPEAPARSPSQRALDTRPGPPREQRPELLELPPQATSNGHVPGQKM